MFIISGDKSDFGSITNGVFSLLSVQIIIISKRGFQVRFR